MTSSDTRTRRILLLGIAIVLVVSGVALAVWALVPRGASDAATTPRPTASVSVSPSQTPDVAEPTAPTSSVPAATTAPPPAAGAVRILSFDAAAATVRCADDRASTAALSLSWRSEGAERAWIGVATSDASVQPFAEVPTSVDRYADLEYACRDAEQVFTLTVRGADGDASASISVTRELD